MERDAADTDGQAPARVVTVEGDGRLVLHLAPRDGDTGGDLDLTGELAGLVEAGLAARAGRTTAGDSTERAGVNGGQGVELGQLELDDERVTVAVDGEALAPDAVLELVGDAIVEALRRAVGR